MTENLDPRLDLAFERIVDVPKELVWNAWTQPEHLVHWFTPHPWKTIRCEIDLRPGGRFNTVMQSPEGQQIPGTGCYLEVAENERLTWTNALRADFRPAPLPKPDDKGMFFFTATIMFASHGSGTRYTATVRHADEAGRIAHAGMGFEEGWGTALEQLVAYVRRTTL